MNGNAAGDEDSALGSSKDDISHHLFDGEEGVHYRRGLTALVQRNEADWQHTQRIRQEGEAAVSYRRSLRHRFWGYPMERDQRLGAGYYGNGCYREAAGGHGRAPQLYGGFWDEVRQGVPHPVGDHWGRTSPVTTGHLETGQWPPFYAAVAHRRWPPPHQDKVDEGAAPRTALRGGGAVGPSCFLPP